MATQQPQPLLEALDRAERQARWESVPAPAQAQAVKLLADMILRAAEAEAEARNERAGTDPDASP